MSMEPHEVRLIIAEVLAEQQRQHQTDLDDIALKTMATLLTSFGIEEDDRAELRADFVHLRRWRKSVEQAQGYGLKAIVTVLVGGFIGALWLGIKMAIIKQ
ncbi:MAG: hypothetical protein EKK40_06985 [Bradyrhizobiaceae bacterium]|nr:MAG: hypothetical protein EKK40_06985 [Bradyrhizobiaceae bacterium]